METIHGTATQFDPQTENWTNYTERLGHYFVANGVDDAGKRKAILLAACGPATFKLIQSVVGVDALQRSTYPEIVATMKEHFDPPPSPIVQRFKFNSRMQEERESITSYLAALRALAEHCNYGDILSNMLKDRLVCGVNNAKIQNRLLAEKNLTYHRAKELALAQETADRDTHYLKKNAAASGSSPANSGTLN